MLGLIDTAKREFARTLPAAPLESQAERLETQDQIDRLLRENDQLKAELTALHAGVAAMPVRTRAAVDPAGSADTPIISITPSTSEPVTAPAADDSPITYAPVEAAPVEAPPDGGACDLALRHAFGADQAFRRCGPPAHGGQGRHTLQPGAEILRQPFQVRDIFEANRDVLPSQNSLRLGMELRIPESCRRPRSAPPSSPSH